MLQGWDRVPWFSGRNADVANYINFFHTTRHRAAAIGLADPDVVEDAGRRSRSKSGTEGFAQRPEGHPGGDRGHRAGTPARCDESGNAPHYGNRFSEYDPVSFPEEFGTLVEDMKEEYLADGCMPEAV